MHLPKFEYLTPETTEEASALLARHQGDAAVLAGGTDLVVRMRQRSATPGYVIALKSVKDMDYIRYDGADGLRIGALTPLHVLETSETVNRHYAVVAESVAQVASPQVRNVGTLGGNLCLDTRCWYYNKSLSWRQSRALCFKTGGSVCHVVKGGKRCYALFCADTAAALISSGAKIKIVGQGGNHLIALEDFYSGTGAAPFNSLVAGQIISEIQIPVPLSKTGSTYLKYGLRKSVDFPLVGVAAQVRVSEDSKECVDARLVLSAVASAPIRAKKTEAILRGGKMTDQLLAAAAEASVKEIGPVVSRGTSADYKRKLIMLSVREAVIAAWDKARTAEN